MTSFNIVMPTWFAVTATVYIFVANYPNIRQIVIDTYKVLL